MKLLLLLLSLIPLFVLAKHRREDAKEQQYERPKHQHLRRLELPKQVPIVSCAGAVVHFALTILVFQSILVVLSSLIMSHDFLF
jgi:hypothetical protein